MKSLYVRVIAPVLAGAALAAVVATPAQAHRQWLLPSAATFSGDEAWVSVDAAVSNDLFFADHRPMSLDAVKAWAPDGSEAPLENKAKGQYRSTFDVHLTQHGTYRIGSFTEMLAGSYDLAGKTERLPRGTTRETLAQAVPAGATNIRTSEVANRNEIYVTVGAPTTTVFKATGKGIELVPVTHPDDLVAGESATFQFLLDGKPAAALPVTVVPGGIRYRNQLNEMNLTTGADGKVTITWPTPGMYWLNVATPRNADDGEEGQGSAPVAAPLPRRASYVTVLEVLAP